MWYHDQILIKKWTMPLYNYMVPYAHSGFLTQSPSYFFSSKHRFWCFLFIG